jgi:hypothetical protein
MKKFGIALALAIAVVIVAAALVFMFAANDAKQTANSREWTMGLGTLDSVPKRYPPRKTNAAALELERLAKPIGVDFQGRRDRGAGEVATYLRTQLARPEATIDPAPAFLEQNRAGIDAVRAHLLSAGPLEWELDLSHGLSGPMPSFRSQMEVGRLLTANALDRARRGDAGAWDDLRAEWELTRNLWQRPEMISSMIGLTLARHIAAAARKMPAPAPAWFNEVRTFDYRKAMLASLQSDTWIIGAELKDVSIDDSGMNPIRRVRDWMAKPYLVMARADFLAHQRETAAVLAKAPTCALDPAIFQQVEELAWWNRIGGIVMPNTTLLWQRVFRIRAELELTEHALGLRGGPQSQCADGTWIITQQSVKFSKDIPSMEAGVPGIPLEIRR